MSEAWAAVVAAVAAGFFGIGGILTGIIVGRRQTTDQATVEHGQWLRGQRQQAYLAFLSAAGTGFNALAHLLVELDQRLPAPTDSRGVMDFALRIQEITLSASKAEESIQLLGPTSVVGPTEDWGMLMYQLSEELRQYARTPHSDEEVEAKSRDLLNRLTSLHLKRQTVFESVRQVLAAPPVPTLEA
ncbi:hypothetical protein [Streptomyces sp. NBC_01261]|uniref:hypothetical protein n=1 Tax=unclassified Streptomyces TaxID=2593676 RepID=UPI002E37148E|nr:hypothetical protein [Streptomyces sp. NBC_01261]